MKKFSNWIYFEHKSQKVRSTASYGAILPQNMLSHLSRKHRLNLLSRRTQHLLVMQVCNHNINGNILKVNCIISKVLPIRVNLLHVHWTTLPSYQPAPLRLLLLVCSLRGRNSSKLFAQTHQEYWNWASYNRQNIVAMSVCICGSACATHLPAEQNQHLRKNYQ